MATSSANYRNDPAKREAAVRLECRFEAAIGEYDSQSVHVEVKPRCRPEASGEVEFIQVISDLDVARVVDDVTTLGNVRILDLTENEITDAAVEPLSRLTAISELWLSGTKITESGIATLVEALPNTSIVHDFAEPNSAHGPESL